MFNINFLHRKSAPSNGSVSIDGRRVRLVIGLGNPGDKYRRTYHNVGFLLINSLAEATQGNDNGQRITWKSIKSFRYAICAEAILVKTTSFMNESGRAVKSAIDYFGVNPDEILIIHDDSDIPLGEYKISFGRGSAGHKGIESIIKTLRTKEFLRMRIGIRPKAGLSATARRAKAGEFVLSKIPQKESQELQELFAKVQRLYFESDGK